MGDLILWTADHLAVLTPFLIAACTGVYLAALYYWWGGAR